MNPAAALVKRFEWALERFNGAYADAYADAEDRGDAKRALNDARIALLAALAEQWQPIETCPEDTNVLVATTGGWVDTAFWTDDGDGPKWWWLVSANEHAKHPLHPNLIPTHWMPLPKHPTV